MPKRVLVVDDQQYLRDVQVLLLKEAGYVATAIGSGVEALARLPDLSPDLIVLDMSMPVMDGRQFLMHLRDTDRWAHTPVILSSGHDIDEMEALREPIVDVLHKPFSDRTLLERVRKMIGDAEA
jgi:twitching motility two-component system response regulator PilG